MATKAQPKAPVPAQPQGGAVVPWQEKLAQEAAAAASSEAAISQFVSFRGGILSYNGQEIKDNVLDVIVLDSAYEHAFYGDMVEGKPVLWGFDPDNPRNPSCYAYGRVETELAPIPDEVEHAVSEACEGCPLNEWASDPEGGKGKACKNVRRLALMDASVLQSNNPDAVKAATVVFAKLPVTSGKNWSSFVIQLANVMKRPTYAVVAKMKVVRNARTQFEVQWEYVDNVPDALIPALMEKREKMGDLIMFNYPKNDEQPDAAAAPKQAPKTAGKYAAGQQPPKPQKAVKK